MRGHQDRAAARDRDRDSGGYEDSVEYEMGRLEKEMRKSSIEGHREQGGLQTYNPSVNYNSASSPLAQALESQIPARHFIPRQEYGLPVPKNKQLDIFGAEVNSGSKINNARNDSPTREMRLQRRQQQEEYARQVAEAAERVPSGGLKRNVYLTGDSLLNQIGGDVSARSPLRPSSDPHQQQAREDKRAAQQKYADLIRQDS
jgi:hypothetical protein